MAEITEKPILISEEKLLKEDTKSKDVIFKEVFLKLSTLKNKKILFLINLKISNNKKEIKSMVKLKKRKVIFLHN